MRLSTRRNLTSAAHRTFGCRAWVHIPEQRRKKLDARSAPLHVHWVPRWIKGAKVRNPLNMRATFSRMDVLFDEETLGLQEVDAAAS